MSQSEDLPKIYLNPGELAICDQPTEVSTVLGSCVAVVLYCPRYRLGAISHAMLPTRADGGKETTFDAGYGSSPYKYVDTSVTHMLDYFSRRQLRKADFVVKIFGGADMFDAQVAAVTGTVGRQNIEAAKALLRSNGLMISAGDIGGRQGRKIVFYSHTGEVYLKRLNKSWHGN